MKRLRVLGLPGLTIGAMHFFVLLAVAASLSGTNVRVSNTDFFPGDPYASVVGPPADVFQQNEPHIVRHPTNPNILAVGMNDVRTLSVSNDAWQGLAVSGNGGGTWSEQLVRGWPGDPGCPAISPVCGNAAGSDPVLGFDNNNHLFFSFIAFHRTPPGRPDFDRQDANAIAVARYSVNPSTGDAAYEFTSIVERGTVGLGRQEDKQWLAVDNTGSPFQGNVYTCWSRFTGSFDHLAFSRSTDGGATWSRALLLDNGTAMQGCYVVVAPDQAGTPANEAGTVYVFYRKFRTSAVPTPANQNGIFVIKSTNGGVSFGPPVHVSDFVDYRQIASRTPPRFRTFTIPAAAADENGVYVTWVTRNTGTGADLKVAFSTNGGSTWIQLNDAPHEDSAPDLGHQLMPAMAAAGGKLSVIWYDSRSEPSFTANGPVTGSDNDAGPGCDGNPDIATPTSPEPDDAVPGCGMDVYYNQISTAFLTPGQTWDGELRLTAGSWNPNLWGSIKAITPFIGDYIAVAADGTTAYAVWGDNRDINAAVQRCDAGENPAAGQCEDASTATDPPTLINQRSRDSNIYFQKVTK